MPRYWSCDRGTPQNTAMSLNKTQQMSYWDTVDETLSDYAK